MAVCGYASYQDPRLVPPDVGDDDTPTPAECWEECIHGNACRALLARQRGWDCDDENEAYWEDKLAADLGCAECELWEEEKYPALMCQNRKLRELGIEVD